MVQAPVTSATGCSRAWRVAARNCCGGTGCEGEKGKVGRGWHWLLHCALRAHACYVATKWASPGERERVANV